MTPVLALVALQCTLCWTIKVPVEWNANSEVQNNQFINKQNESPVQTVTPHSVETPIPKEYFEYTAKKPQFATDVAAFHGVKFPDKLYKAYPVRPHTGAKKPELGIHHMIDSGNHAFEPYQKFVKNNEHVSYVTPASSNYNVFHPYEAEEPSLKAIYQDPILTKIRSDLKDSQYRLQNYENDAGESNIQKEEYLESPKQTDRKIYPHKHTPAQFEIHRPQRRPIYYLPPVRYGHRDHILNQKIRHPWNQNYAKVTPFHYRPIKNHLHRLRQQHALKYDDENNEYPQIQPPLGYEEKPDGYDIYENGKEKFTQLRHNVDESISNAVKKNRPSSHEKLELQNTTNGYETTHDDNEFLPVKNYAQVRKIETEKHLPRSAAYQDAETYDELRNAPRLREAIKSTKAQTVYSEEGYEDSAYDHAGEQKHASDHEGHGGYLKEKELSKGKYKIPSFSGSYEDGRASSYRDNIQHGEKWKNDDKKKEKLKEEEDYSEDDQEYVNESDLDENTPNKKSSIGNEKTNYYSPENHINSDTIPDADLQHDLSKREAKIKIPEINLNTTFLSKDQIANISLIKLPPIENANITNKYPYYHKKEINKDSPLRYAENLKNIPRKSKGGTEFYDSRTRFECPEVDNDVDPIPEKLKNGGNPNDAEDNNANENVDVKPRLNGLGDKIDCFKIKYFGENPLDSPFFEEDLISNPEPVNAPSSQVFKIFENSDSLTLQSQVKSIILKPEQSNNDSELIEIERNNTEKLQPVDEKLDLSSKKTSVDFSKDIKKELKKSNLLNSDVININKTKQIDVLVRKPRAAPFIYEPYKIIRDSQIQDSKKTTTSSNISPLIKQLQSSRVVDKVTTNMNKDQPVKRNTGSLAYRNIGKKDRENVFEKLTNGSSNSTFIDVNEDTREIEPRFEQRPVNHKLHYTPVENKNSMSLETYRNRTNFKNVNDKETKTISIQPTDVGSNTPHHRRPFFDVSKYLPHILETQKTEPSNNVQKIKEIMQNAPGNTKERPSVSPESQESKENDEEYDDYEEEEEEELITSTTTTTTIKPLTRKRTRIMTTTYKPQSEANHDKLRLVTRFRNTTSKYQNPLKKDKEKVESSSLNKKIEEDDHIPIPKYREKKKKSSKSTLVTDSTSYGEDDDDDDDMRKEEVDDLIGIQHDMEEYIPRYEKEAEKEHEIIKSKKQEDKANHSRTKENNNEEDEDETDHHIDSEEEDDDDNDDDENEDDDIEDDNNSSENQDDSGEDEEEENYDKIDKHTTTPEPPRRTLIKTTELPQVTTKIRIPKPEVKPIISKKKIEIHKELPYTKSSPNVTQFKQDIKEVEIVKEIPAPKKKTHNVPTEKDAEILQLYKDENLAKEVNKLFDVEVFKEDLDLKKSPRHGGNYRSIQVANSDKHKIEPATVSKKDSLSSQTQTKKRTEPGSSRIRNSGSTRMRNATQQSTKNRGQSTDAERYRYRDDDEKNIQKNAKIIELSEDEEDRDISDTENIHGRNFKTYSSSQTNGNQMHGGNYRSARITQSDKHNNHESQNTEKERNGETTKNIRRNSAALLDSFARAVPILTTTPAYILDPSKRKYYYVDS